MIDATRKWYFSPDDDTRTAYFAWLQTATKKVRIADFTFNLPEFDTILPDMQQRGLDVALVLDRLEAHVKSEVVVLDALRASKIPMMIGTSSKHQIMHSKFTVIDDEWIQAGSWNYTVVASDQDNFFLIEHNPTLAKVFSDNWQEMYNWIQANEAQPV